LLLTEVVALEALLQLGNQIETLFGRQLQGSREDLLRVAVMLKDYRAAREGARR
jgi:hypothetical protein